MTEVQEANFLISCLPIIELSKKYLLELNEKCKGIKEQIIKEIQSQ